MNFIRTLPIRKCSVALSRIVVVVVAIVIIAVRTEVNVDNIHSGKRCAPGVYFYVNDTVIYHYY